MKINLTFAHLHGPLFFAGANWGEKLDVKNTQKGKITLIYDREFEELLVSSGDKMTIIPKSNIVSMTPAPDGVNALKHETELDMMPKMTPGSIPPPKGKIKAQASSPMDHVFAGVGAGKTNDKQ